MSCTFYHSEQIKRLGAQTTLLPELVENKTLPPNSAQKVSRFLSAVKRIKNEFVQKTMMDYLSNFEKMNIEKTVERLSNQGLDALIIPMDIDDDEYQRWRRLPEDRDEWGIQGYILDRMPSLNEEIKELGFDMIKNGYMFDPVETNKRLKSLFEKYGFHQDKFNQTFYPDETSNQWKFFGLSQYTAKIDKKTLLYIGAKSNWANNVQSAISFFDTDGDIYTLVELHEPKNKIQIVHSTFKIPKDLSLDELSILVGKRDGQIVRGNDGKIIHDFSLYDDLGKYEIKSDEQIWKEMKKKPNYVNMTDSERNGIFFFHKATSKLATRHKKGEKVLETRNHKIIHHSEENLL